MLQGVISGASIATKEKARKEAYRTVYPAVVQLLETPQPFNTYANKHAGRRHSVRVHDRRPENE